MSEYEDMTLEELRDECRARDLKISGSKDELVARLELNDHEVEFESGDEPQDDEPTPVDGGDEGDGEPEPEPEPEGGDESDDSDEGEPANMEPSGLLEQRIGDDESRKPAPVSRAKGPTAQEQSESPFPYAIGPDGLRHPFED
jgi:hypothetical protein